MHCIGSRDLERLRKLSFLSRKSAAIDCRRAVRLARFLGQARCRPGGPLLKNISSLDEEAVVNEATLSTRPKGPTLSSTEDRPRAKGQADPYYNYFFNEEAVVSDATLSRSQSQGPDSLIYRRPAQGQVPSGPLLKTISSLDEEAVVSAVVSAATLPRSQLRHQATLMLH